jgi:hypothetical protein
LKSPASEASQWRSSAARTVRSSISISHGRKPFLKRGALLPIAPVASSLDHLVGAQLKMTAQAR